jgi:ribosome-binding factor A
MQHRRLWEKIPVEDKRVDRISHLIKREVADMLRREVKDPRIGMVSITEVNLSKDLRYAHIYYSVIGEEKAVSDSTVGLKKATGFIQRQLGHRLCLRYTPIIDFRFDSSLEQGSRMEQIIRDLSLDADSVTETDPEKQKESS